MNITVSVIVKASLEQAWKVWLTPEHIKQWNFASEDWECPSASVDLRIGGQLASRMQAKDGSFGFDLVCTFTQIVEYEMLEYEMEDGRVVEVKFREIDGGIEIIETFDAEDSNPIEMQQAGWQSILNNYKRYIENS